MSPKCARVLYIMFSILFLAPGTDSLARVTSRSAHPVFARARLLPMGGSSASGTVAFAKTPDGLLIQADIVSTPPGAHGIQIHESGDCNQFRGSVGGGHWNPTRQPHGAPNSRLSHVGDLGNILAVPDQTGVMVILLRNDPNSFGGWEKILGRVVVMHKVRDNLKSNPDGNSGPAISCGVIEQVRKVAE